MALLDEVVDFLLQRATVLRVIGDADTFPVTDTGATQRTYTQVATDVPCKVFLYRPHAKMGAGGGTYIQSMYGMMNVLGTGALFALDAPIRTGDRIVVDGVTYMITFHRIVYADDAPSHLITDVERVAVEPFLDPAGAV